MILLMGCHGSMGRRYQAILKFLQKDFVGVDKEHNRHYVNGLMAQAAGVIIATPTGMHAEHIRWAMEHRKPIMCEKPILKDVGALKELLSDLRRSQTPFRMMFQYSMLADRKRIGPSLYNYFRHGSDGIHWDCLQIIGLARGALELKEDSPVWSCKLNGQRIPIQQMDAAYIGYVQHWFRKPMQDHGDLIAIHEKTAEMEKKNAL